MQLRKVQPDPCFGKGGCVAAKSSQSALQLDHGNLFPPSPYLAYAAVAEAGFSLRLIPRF